MQLVAEGELDLEDPVSDYGVSLESQGIIRVKHLLSHTSEGVPGTQHSYSGYRYGLLAKVVQGATGKSFGRLLSERIHTPLEMSHSAPRSRRRSAITRG